MKYKILLKDNREIQTNLTAEESQRLFEAMKRKDVRMVEIDGRMIDAGFIKMIEQDNEVELIEQKFRLEERKYEKTEEGRKGMEKLFDYLKSRNILDRYSNYQDFRDKKYGKGVAK